MALDPEGSRGLHARLCADHQALLLRRLNARLRLHAPAHTPMLTNMRTSKGR